MYVKRFLVVVVIIGFVLVGCGGLGDDMVIGAGMGIVDGIKIEGLVKLGMLIFVMVGNFLFFIFIGIDGKV